MKAFFIFLSFSLCPARAVAPAPVVYCPMEAHYHYFLPAELKIDMDVFTLNDLEELRTRIRMCRYDQHCMEIYPMSEELWFSFQLSGHRQKLVVFRTIDGAAEFVEKPLAVGRKTARFVDPAEEDFWSRYFQESL